MKKLWNFFKGHKRNIGVILTWVLKGVVLTRPDLLTPELHTWIDNGIDALLLFGTGDAIARSGQTKVLAGKAGKLFNQNK